MIRTPILLAAFYAATLGAQPPVRPKAPRPERQVPPPRPERAPTPKAPRVWHPFAIAPEPMQMFELPEMPDFPELPELPEMWHEPMLALEPFFLHEMPPMPPMPAMPAMPEFEAWVHTPITPMVAPTPPTPLRPFEQAWHFTPKAWDPGSPRKAWAPEDPADSLYRRARELLNRGEYRQAAGAFRDISTKFATSQYAASALYWQAFALYRIGGVAELREALTALETQKTKYPSAKTESDVGTLQARILGALAQRGDAAAQRQLAQAAQQGQSCENDEDQGVRVEALRALYQSDPETVAPLIQQVLNRKDDCSIQLRRNAIFLIGNRKDQSATGVLANVARTDPSLDVRVEAISWLGRIGDDAALEVIEDLLRSSNEERIQRAAIRALANHPNPKALQRVRALVERNDAPERLRSEAISTFDRERITSDETAWLRNLYPRLGSTSLKQRAVSVIARVGGADNEAWLQTILRNEDEPSEVRSTILSRLGQSMAIADLGKMYDGASSRMVREYIIGALARRTEPESTDKLLDIAKNGTDPSLRRSAISALTRKNDPRATRLLLELISK
jgi:HEAT repeat protein